jgi:putative RNA 2'-phosphotransferase
MTNLTAASKFLAYVLRHNPAAIGVQLDHHGWIDVETLLTAAAGHGHDIDAATLRAILDAPGKRRFEVGGGRIRAAQGHSLAVDLGLDPAVPPARLYHGTVARFVPNILAEGLKPGKRAHVHLSVDRPTAELVGSRRGAPVVLVVDGIGAHRQGQVFYLAANGVWLTGPLSPSWIRLG